MGLTFTLDETLHDEGPGRWRFLVPGPGFEIVDRYEVTSTETGAHLEIRSTISYDHLPGKLAQRVIIPNGKQTFTEVFSGAVAAFEEHARTRPPRTRRHRRERTERDPQRLSGPAGLASSVIDVKLRTTLLMVAAFGLVAGALTPTATADTEVPPDPGECYQVYFFYEEIGPVTVDASDSCWQVIVDHVEECENADATYEDLDDCREAIEDELNATCTDATPMSIACAIETDPCQLVTTNPCNIYCTCPVHPQAYPTPIEK